MGVIKNKDALSTTPLRADALRILEAGYEAIDTEAIIRRKVTFRDGVLEVAGTKYNTKDFSRILFLGIGKCALQGARIIEDILGDALSTGLTIDVQSDQLKKIRSFAGTHPAPSEANAEAAREACHLLEGITARDLVIVLISGGGSALLCDPHGMTWMEMAEVYKNLTKKGADIYELNTVRKHLAKMKGGGLAALAYPATVVSLIFSDVLGNDLSVIASGPTVMDRTTIEDATKVLQKYEVALPRPALTETPKDPKFFEKVNNVLLVTNHDALVAMRDKAVQLGYHADIETETLSGNAREVGEAFAERNIAPKNCILAGGETTVIVHGGGTGGRNQEMALGALLKIPPNLLFISAASDGMDNTLAAGAIADVALRKEADARGLSMLDYLARSDSYHFFQKVDGALSTGPTGSNVSDLYILIST